MKIYDLFLDALKEKNISILELEQNGVLGKNTFYDFCNYAPSLENAIKIANYLEMSLDYILNLKDINLYKKYNYPPQNFYTNLISIMKKQNITQYKLCGDLKISRANFSRWKNGAVPKLSTLILLTKYLVYFLDDLL